MFMADSLGLRLDIKQILLEAQHRWLRPSEICEILLNYQTFHITPEAPCMPVSGSVFLFDRKTLRYFRKDGHNWRKKKDGKTVKEAHEKLKVGSVERLHCYYAHGEDNENFQRRCYWLLEQDLMHIVFVHYLEVKGSKTHSNFTSSAEPIASPSQNDSSLSYSYPESCIQLVSASPDLTSPTSTVTSLYEDGFEDNQKASPSFQSYNSWVSGYIDDDLHKSSFLRGSQKEPDLMYWEEVLGHNIADKQESGNLSPAQAHWQDLLGDSPLHLETILGHMSLPEKDHSNTELGYTVNEKSNDSMESMGNEKFSRILKQSLAGGSPTDDSLKKVDSFSRWIAKELGEVDNLAMQSSGGISWSVLEGENAVDDACMTNQLQLDMDTLSPSLSQDQLFTIIDFSPNWAYSTSNTEVLITGTFLGSKQGATDCRWSCMFGEVEVPAEVSADGVLRCHAPPHRAGLVSFYITCSNRLACSEVREFEYRAGTDFTNAYNSSAVEIHLFHRLECLLSVQPVGKTFKSQNVAERKEVVNQLISMMEEEKCRVGKLKTEWDVMQPKAMDEQLAEKHLKEIFYSWILYKVTEDGTGPAVLDEDGQSVLHLAAALGCNWILQPMIVSGVSIDFRDVNGWTAIHWAAFYGREETVAALVHLGAAPGALTDPSTEFPLGRTAADLASVNGHKGISGFLAESSLITHLSSLNMNDLKDSSTLANGDEQGIRTVSERVAISTTQGEAPDVLSLRDSLAAICISTQAAARIHQIFRIQSFQRKQLVEQGSDDLLQDEHTLALLAAKSKRLGQVDGASHAAAVCIQKKYRGWKKRKEFLLIRQRIVKIQAHVRGHQVRKMYKPIVWSVGILEKLILRWRRRRSGLRGFRKETVTKDPSTQGKLQPEDDYDFLKEGRKQTEERLQKALVRVKSMAQYPEARAQYHRLLTVAKELHETKDASNMITGGSEGAIYPEEELLDVQCLLDDDSFMSLAFE